MWGAILPAAGSFFEEISSAIGKFEVSKHAESIYTMVFLNMFWAVVFYAGIGLWRGTLFLSYASLPTFAVRAVFEVLQIHLGVRAIVQADRSTFSFLRTITIPLLLVVDLFLGYAFDKMQIIGIALILATFVILFVSRGISKDGVWLTVLSSVNAVIPISFFKYDITYYNSVEAEQAFMLAILLCYFLAADLLRSRENPFRFFLKPVFFAQSAAHGVAIVLHGFAYLFAPAAVIASAGRSSAIFWSVVSGNRIFKEDHIILRSVLLVLSVAGVILLAL
ncbi:MAG: hypothetical protein A2676_01225 [Candidatus Sungbacteria bacterium RIFCSPHIGHO2_01_FULL_51_22]|nr:MAG: hypothetical protein A2676_01225 [Candidatus Sungbacteria bacterium RIFCSPHIGHO2_01_FULL_51_22]